MPCLDLQEIIQYEDAKNLLNESDLDENTPLHVAAKNGFAIIVEVGFNRVFVLLFFRCRIKTLLIISAC